MSNFEEIKLELANVNSSKSFWQALDSDFSHLGCSCQYHAEEEFLLEGNFLLAKEEVKKIISRVFVETDHKSYSVEDLFVLFAINKMQDQVSGGVEGKILNQLELKNFVKNLTFHKL